MSLIINRYGKRKGIQGTKIIIQEPNGTSKCLTVHTSLDSNQIQEILNIYLIQFFHSGNNYYLKRRGNQ